jgi:hypothetical protein
VRVLRDSQNHHHPTCDEQGIQCHANYDRINGPPDPLDANNPIDEEELCRLHDEELQHRARYDQDNDAPDDLYIAPTGHRTNYNDNVGAAVTNNVLDFS